MDGLMFSRSLVASLGEMIEENKPEGAVIKGIIEQKLSDLKIT